MSLQTSYTLIAPFYDAFLARATRGARRRSLESLHTAPAGDVLLVGVGTGLDLPLLPARHRYTGVDLTAAMLRRAGPRVGALDYCAVQGDVQRLPLADASFDVAILHLILAVVPEPVACLREAQRVLRPGGQLLVFDKFLRPGERSWKHLLNPLSRRVATRLDVVFEEVLSEVGGLRVLSNQPALASGWFRLIRLEKTAHGDPHDLPV